MAKNETEMTCICCPIGCSLFVRKTPQGYEVSGNRCPRGKKYAIEEMTAPKRIIPTTVKVSGGNYPVVPVKTAAPVPKEKIFEIMKIISKVEVMAPVNIGDIIVENIADTGVDIVATANRKAMDVE